MDVSFVTEAVTAGQVAVIAVLTALIVVAAVVIAYRMLLKELRREMFTDDSGRIDLDRWQSRYPNDTRYW